MQAEKKRTKRTKVPRAKEPEKKTETTDIHIQAPSTFYTPTLPVIYNRLHARHQIKCQIQEANQPPRAAGQRRVSANNGAHPIQQSWAL
jgi:hypothetical protein